MTILVAIPYLPTLPEALLARMRALAAALVAHSPQAVQVVCTDGTVAVAADAPRYSAHALARNRLLDRHLRAHHTHVLWIDADLTAYPPDLPQRLLAVDAQAIVAPLVLIEESQAFYDVHGFIEVGGRAFQSAPPYARQMGERIECLAVGCCYIVPASLYRDGVRYRPTHGHTEHYSVCQAARTQGLPVVALRSIRIEHANLPRYGVAWN